MKRRWIDTLIGVGLVIALVGGALLFDSLRGVADEAHTTAAETADVGQKNSALICALGTAVARSRIEQRAEENLNEFRRRVQNVRRFVAELNELDDCDAKPPNKVHLKKKDREKLRQERRERKGGGRQQGNPPSQQPAPGNGGSGGGSGGGGKIVGKPPTRPPPQPPGVLDPVCDVAEQPVLDPGLIC